MRIVAFRLVLLLFGLVPLTVSAQEGVVRYNHTFEILTLATDQISVHLAELDGEEKEPYPSQSTIGRSLAFGPQSSLMYPTLFQPFEPGDRPDWEYVDTTYIDFDEGVYVESREFDANIYRVTGELPVIPWRLTGEERKYLDYRVMKATAVMDSAVVDAWFSPEIPVPAGPGLYSGLPGLILMVTNTSIGEVYAAESVELGEQDDRTAPLSGRRISRADYDQQVSLQIEYNQRIWNTTKRKLDNSYKQRN